MTNPFSLLPPAVCPYWTETAIVLYVVGNLLIFLAYAGLPLVLWRLYRRCGKLPEIIAVPAQPILLLFALFIFFCGAGRLIESFTVWYPAPLLGGIWRIATGVIALVTLQATWKTARQAL